MRAGQKELKDPRPPYRVHEHEHGGKEDQCAPVDPAHHLQPAAAEEKHRQSRDQGDIGERKVLAPAQEHRSHLGQNEKEKQDERQPGKPGQSRIGYLRRLDLQSPAIKLSRIKQPQQQIGQDEVGHCGKHQMLQEDGKRIGEIGVDCYEQILGVSDGAHGAADSHSKGQGEQEHLGRDLQLPREINHQGRADDGQGVIHEQGGEEAHGKKDEQHQLIDISGPSEDAVEDIEQIAALLHGLAYDEHGGQKNHHIGVDGLHSLLERDLAGKEDGQGSGKHDLPDGQGFSPCLAQSDEQENRS